MPMTVFVEDGVHCRERDGRLLVLGPGPERETQPDGAGRLPEPTGRYDHAWAGALLDSVRPRLPLLGSAHGGPYGVLGRLLRAVTRRARDLGRAPGVPDMILVNGSSGHGVMHAPALGLLVSELLLDGRHRVDGRAERCVRSGSQTGEPEAVPDLF